MYSGAIISSLTSESPPIQSIGDLLTSSVEIYVDPDSSTIQRIIQHLRATSPRKQGFQNTKEDVSLRTLMGRPGSLKGKPGAAIGFARNFYRSAHNLDYSPNELCDCISRFPILKLPLQNGMMVPLWSPFRETFNHE